MSTDSPLRCFVCGSTATTPNIEVHTDTGYDLARCGSCETLFTDARNAPPASELYPAFSQSADGVAAASNKAASGFLRKRVSVAQSVSRSGRSLDFGAGNGAFARAMQAAGFDSVGLEPFSLGAPTTSPGLKLLRAPLADVADDLGQFDVITMWHVFEHLDNPVEVLRQLAGHLTPTGAFVISVPNERSWQRRVFRRSWFHLDPPRHLIHFDASTLADVLGRADLQVKANHPFLPEYGTSAKRAQSGASPPQLSLRSRERSRCAGQDAPSIVHRASRRVAADRRADLRARLARRVAGGTLERSRRAHGCCSSEARRGSYRLSSG
jgi:SAM-dependent methyltransferase